MKINSKKCIKAHLNTALKMQKSTICILKGGVTETEHIHSEDPVIYKKIEFRPQYYLDADYIGLMFYPNGKSQGKIDFDVSSFESVICLEEGMNY